MFKLSKKETYSWPVTVQSPKDGGGWMKATFTAEFKRLPQNQIDDIKDAGDETFLREVMVGFSGVGDEDGNPLPFSEDNLTTLLNDVCARIALARAWWESVKGKEGKLGN